MNCPACNAENRDGARFCDSCGGALDAVGGAEARRTIGDGRYEIGERLGEGARKVVYRGTDTRLGRDVAVALIKTEGLDAAGRARVQRESQAMARLGDNAHVVSVFDAGEQDDQPFIVSQLLSGGSLDQHLADSSEEALDPLEAIRIGGEVAAALTGAHAQGVVHRDIKPTNIWLGADGGALLGDFGLAQVSDQSKLTVEGMIVGTAAYLAPEVAIGGTADARSDLYALGAVLYELCTGRPPFTGDLTEVVSQHVNTAPVHPVARNEQVPGALDELIMRLLAKDPLERPGDAASVAAELVSMAGTPDGAGSAEATVAPDTPLATGFVGRQAHLDRLGEVLADVLTGQARLVLVAGEPGVGKTATVEQLCADARVRGCEVLWGRSYEGEIGAPYLPFVEAFRTHVRNGSPDELREELGAAAPEMATLVSEVREKIVDLPELPRLEGSAERLRLFEAVVAFVQATAERQPVVIVLDDLHWADEPTLLLLQYLARNLHHDRVLLVGTYRDVELDRTHPLSDAVASLRRTSGFERVLLRGLDRDEVADLIESAGGQEPPDELVAAVHEISEGNPFFVAEILRNLVESGAIREEDGRYVGDRDTVLDNLPEGVREAVGRRLDRLSEDANRLLSVGSAMPGGFSLDVAAPVAGQDIDQALDLLDEALAAAIVAERDDAPGTYEFGHALIRQALYEELSTPRRVRMHQRIGEAVERRFADRLEPHLTELAYHFFQAAPGGDADKARDYATRAGNRALSGAAYEEAARYFDMALQVLDLEDRPEPGDRGAVLVRLLEASTLSGDATADGSSETLQAAVECARQADDPELFSQAVITTALRSWGDPYRVDEPLVALLREALDRLPPEHHAVRADLWTGLTRQLFFHEVDDAATTATEAMAEAEASDDPVARARAMYAATVGGLPSAASLDFGRQFVATAEEAGDLETQNSALTSLMMRLLINGDRPGVDGCVADLEDLTARLRAPRFSLGMDQTLAMMAAIDGRFDSAEEQIMASLGAAHRMGYETAVANAGVGLYQVRREQGRLGELESSTRRVAEAPDALPSWRGGLIGLLTETGQLDEAAALLDQLDLEAIPDDVLRRYTYCVLAEAAARVGDREAGAWLREALTPDDGTHATIASVAYWGAVSRYLGLLAQLAGELDSAVGHLRSAEGEHEAMRAPAWLARTRYDLARVLIERDGDGDRDEARALLDAALHTAREIGAARLVEQAMVEKVTAQGLAGSDPGTSIDLIAATLDRDAVDEQPGGRAVVGFSDIESYTVLTERLGDTRSQQVLHRHNDIIRSALGDHGGTEVKSQGDGFMVVFDAPEGAARWALAVHAAMATYDFGDDAGPLRVRIGLHEGEVIVEDDDYYGRTVIIAARVAATASGGATLITEHLHDLLDGSVGTTGDPESVELKGLSGSYSVYPLLGRR